MDDIATQVAHLTALDDPAALAVGETWARRLGLGVPADVSTATTHLPAAQGAQHRVFAVDLEQRLGPHGRHTPALRSTAEAAHLAQLNTPGMPERCAREMRVYGAVFAEACDLARAATEPAVRDVLERLTPTWSGTPQDLILAAGAVAGAPGA